MKRSVTAPDGTRWIVRTTSASWRPQPRKSFELDPVGLVLWVASWPVFLLEVIGATATAALSRLRRRISGRWDVEAVTEPPGRRLVWKQVADQQQSISEIADGISSGLDVSLTADLREAG